MKFSLVGVRRHHRFPLLWIQKCHCTSSIITDLEKWKENLCWAVWLMQTEGVLMGWQLFGFVGMNELQDLSLLYGVCKAEQVCLLLWNSFSWCERVTLSVGCTRLSSQKKRKYVLWNLCWWGPRGNKEKSQMHVSGCTWETVFFFQILIKISAQLSTWRPSLATSTHSVILSPSCLIFLQSAYHSSKLPCLFLIVHLPTLYEPWRQEPCLSCLLLHVPEHGVPSRCSTHFFKMDVRWGEVEKRTGRGKGWNQT